MDVSAIAGIGTLSGLGLWLGLWLRARVFPIPARSLLILSLGVGFTCRLAFLWLTPTFYAPDEQSHYNYVKYLAENRSWPVQTSQTDAPTNDWEYYQPPLYYLLLAPLYQASNALFGNAFLTVRVLRSTSILLWGATAWFALRFLRRLNVGRASLPGTFVMAMVCLLPTYVFLSSMINNDNLLVAIGSGLLCLVRPRPSFRRSALVGVLLGAALLTKLTAVVYVGLVALVALVELIREPPAWLATGTRAALTLVLAAVIWAPWGWRNWVVYGNITAEEIANVPRAWPSASFAALATLEYMQRSFWAVSGIYNNVGGAYPLPGRLVSYLAAGGLVYGLVSRRQKWFALVRENAGLIVPLALAIVANLVLVFRFGVLYGQGQGRFLFPLLLPISLFMAVGLAAFPVLDAGRARIHVTGFMVTYALSFAAFSLATFAQV